MELEKRLNLKEANMITNIYLSSGELVDDISLLDNNDKLIVEVSGLIDLTTYRPLAYDSSKRLFAKDS
jgi:hypothetical protein